MATTSKGKDIFFYKHYEVQIENVPQKGWRWTVYQEFDLISWGFKESYPLAEKTARELIDQRVRG